MTREERERLRVLCEALLTQRDVGPWIYSSGRGTVETTQEANCPGNKEHGQVYGAREWGPVEDCRLTHELTHKDVAVGKFIAASRTALPTLLDEVDRLRGLLVEAAQLTDDLGLIDRIDEALR